MESLSFIIPLFNHVAHSQAMLASLQATIPEGLGYEIILIDDFSTDGTRAWLATLDDPHIKTLLNPHNLGYAKTNNIAVSTATGELLALLNNDLLFEPGWLEPMLHTLSSATLNVGLVGNVQYRVADGRLDHAGVLLNANAQFGHIQALEEDAPLQTKVFAVTGACMLLRKADFDSQGGFDEQFVNGCEDFDLCFKLRAAGKAIYVANASRIHHHVSLSRSDTTAQNDRNSRLLYSKWWAELKIELAHVWLHRFRTDQPSAQNGVIHAHFTPAMLDTPQALARVVAESVLRQEESYWERTLDGVDANSNVAERCQIEGLRFIDELGVNLIDRVAELRVTDVRSMRNFFVCGQVQGEKAVTLTLNVNGIQEKFVTLELGANFNVGIIAPVCLPGITNRFRVSVSTPVMVSHFVLDDQIVVPAKSRSTHPIP